MMTLYYQSMLVLSIVLTVIYILMWHKHFDVHITLMFVLVPMTNLGFVLLSQAQTLEEALAFNKLTYLGGCYGMLIVLFIVFSLCDLPMNRWLRSVLLLISTAVYMSVLTMGYSPVFYESVSLNSESGTALVDKQYGVMHTVFLVMVCLYFAGSIGAMVYSYVRKNQVSRKMIYLLFLPVLVCMVCYFAGRRVFPRIDLLPAAYNLALAVYLVIVSRISLYDVTDSAVDSLVQTGDTGFISFDFKLHYLGSNETAKQIIPQLNDLTVDRAMDRAPMMKETARVWLEAFQQDEGNNQAHYETDEQSFLVKVNYLFDGKRKRGYQIFLTDDTQDQQFIKLLNSFNSELQQEVARKTRHIEDMHDQLILGMATMVESRDNSTGGHIRRTSEGVRLLIEEMWESGDPHLTDSFCRNIIKAAPMHDLGKIAVDDKILRKPGRFTPDEFDVMKTHAAEGARIVREILKGTDDKEFQQLAENVAHYHHERWDGSGYPQGLKGEQIPLEARIMAIADVYDALVSKRVYKDSMSFAAADAIMMEGMGKHFDKHLEPFYVSARPKLEAYYLSLEKSET